MTQDSDRTLQFPVETLSAVYPLWLRPDLPRSVASDYWAGPHAEIVGGVLTAEEYVQYHFSATDHGFWPGSPSLGTVVPADWRMDGFPEVRLRSLASSLATLPRMRPIFLDEQNVFLRTVAQITGPGGGRWWTDGFDDSVRQRAVLMLRRRRGTGGSAFRRLVHERLGPAFDAAGARDLRTYTFLPWLPGMHPSPGVAHDNPPERRYHGVVVFGADDRAGIDALIASDAVAALGGEIGAAMTAVHAFAVDRSVPVIRRNG